MTRPEKKKALYAMQRQDEKRCEGIYLNWYWGGGGGGWAGGIGMWGFEGWEKAFGVF